MTCVAAAAVGEMAKKDQAAIRNAEGVESSQEEGWNVLRMNESSQE